MKQVLQGTIYGALIGLAVGTPLVFAQVNRVPNNSISFVSDPDTPSQIQKVNSGGAAHVATTGRLATYSASFVGLAPAASATDVACIAGSATKTISVRQIHVSGTAGTLVSLPMFLAKRATADSGGTAATGNALPVAGKNDTNSGAATATLVSYTANPTINDASPTLLRAGTVTLPVTTAGTSIAPLIWSFGSVNDQSLVIRGAAEQACINLNGVSVSSGLLNGFLTWTEE